MKKSFSGCSLTNKGMSTYYGVKDPLDMGIRLPLAWDSEHCIFGTVRNGEVVEKVFSTAELRESPDSSLRDSIVEYFQRYTEYIRDLFSIDVHDYDARKGELKQKGVGLVARLKSQFGVSPSITITHMCVLNKWPRTEYGEFKTFVLGKKFEQKIGNEVLVKTIRHLADVVDASKVSYTDDAITVQNDAMTVTDLIWTVGRYRGKESEEKTNMIIDYCVEVCLSVYLKRNRTLFGFFWKRFVQLNTFDYFTIEFRDCMENKEEPKIYNIDNVNRVHVMNGTSDIAYLPNIGECIGRPVLSRREEFVYFEERFVILEFRRTWTGPVRVYVPVPVFTMFVYHLGRFESYGSMEQETIYVRTVSLLGKGRPTKINIMTGMCGVLSGVEPEKIPEYPGTSTGAYLWCIFEVPSDLTRQQLNGIMSKGTLLNHLSYIAALLVLPGEGLCASDLFRQVQAELPRGKIMNTVLFFKEKDQMPVLYHGDGSYKYDDFSVNRRVLPHALIISTNISNIKVK